MKMLQQKNLIALLEKLRGKNFGIEDISTTISDEGLKLSLRSGRGFEGYESLIAVPVANLYSVNYYGMISTATDTFLSEDSLYLVDRSEILKSFKKEVESRLKYQRIGYQELLILEQLDREYEEVEESFVLTSEIFRNKLIKKRN